jgi:preprotein translocase subunit SecG
VLSRATTVLAILFFGGALTLGIMRQGDGGSVVGGRAPQAAPAATPTNPAPLAPPTE